MENDNAPSFTNDYFGYTSTNTFLVAPYQRGPHVSFVPDWQQDNHWRFIVLDVDNALDVTHKAVYRYRTWSYDQLLDSTASQS